MIVLCALAFVAALVLATAAVCGLKVMAALIRRGPLAAEDAYERGANLRDWWNPKDPWAA